MFCVQYVVLFVIIEGLFQVYSRMNKNSGVKTFLRFFDILSCSIGLMVDFNILIMTNESNIFKIFFFISDDLIARDIEEFERQKHHLKSNLKVRFYIQFNDNIETNEQINFFERLKNNKMGR